MSEPVQCSTSWCKQPANMHEGEKGLGASIARLFPLCDRCYQARLHASPCEQCCDGDCGCSCHGREEAPE